MRFPGEFERRIAAGWLGKTVGGTLGLPVEGRMERLSLTFFDPVPTSAPPNDDLELQLVWLHLIETSGPVLTPADFAAAWLRHIHYMWDEYGRCRWNLRRGVPVGAVGSFENPFHSGMGSPIRSEIWACLFPGDASSAAYYAAMDASLDHGMEGIAGEVLFAVMQSSVLAGFPLRDAITTACGFIPPDSETSRAISFVISAHAADQSAWDCWQDLTARHGNENFTHAPLNVALTIWALLYGDGDFEKSILLAANGGYDTDCTAATVGATLGFLHGPDGIPERWSRPLGEEVFVGPGILGLSAPRTLTELTTRTCALRGKLHGQKWDRSFWTRITPSVSLHDLAGTINLTPSRQEYSVAWANGELPVEVKRAGGAHWPWHVASDESRAIICLAKDGARLFLDGLPILECPPGLAYVPATHRSPEGSRVQFNISQGTHEVRLELNRRDPSQAASVLLAYPNLHLCPWTASELPESALLPSA